MHFIGHVALAQTGNAKKIVYLRENTEWIVSYAYNAAAALKAAHSETGPNGKIKIPTVK